MYKVRQMSRGRGGAIKSVIHEGVERKVQKRAGGREYLLRFVSFIQPSLESIKTSTSLHTVLTKYQDKSLLDNGPPHHNPHNPHPGNTHTQIRRHHVPSAQQAQDRTSNTRDTPISQPRHGHDNDNHHD